jgi:hypothetical protein
MGPPAVGEYDLVVLWRFVGRGPMLGCIVCLAACYFELAGELRDSAPHSGTF